MIFAVAGAAVDGTRYRVRLEVGGAEVLLDEVATVALQGHEALADVAAGTHELVVTLEAKDGVAEDAPWKRVPGPFNREVRKIILK